MLVDDIVEEGDRIAQLVLERVSVMLRCLFGEWLW